MEASKDRGADVVKQWDSTLDGKTKDSHAQVDGEIRELNKPFSNGLMYPGVPYSGQTSKELEANFESSLSKIPISHRKFEIPLYRIKSNKFVNEY